MLGEAKRTLGAPGKTFDMAVQRRGKGAIMRHDADIIIQQYDGIIIWYCDKTMVWPW